MRDRINILKAHDIRSMNVIIEKVDKESGTIGNHSHTRT